MVYGDETENRNPVKEGAQDAVSTMTKYAVIAGAVYIAGMIFLDKKTIETLKNRFLRG